MTKNITPGLYSNYSREKIHNLSITNNKYIDKGNLTSRECGKLVKNMIEEYERNNFDWQ